MANETVLTQETDNQPETKETPPQNTPPVTDWRTSLPEDLRGEKMFENIKGKDATEVLPTLAKGYRDAQKLVGGSMGKIPGEGAKPEEVKAWQDANLPKLRAAGLIDGAPDAPEKYTAKIMKDGAAVDAPLGDFYKQAHALGLTDKQAQGMLDMYVAQSMQLGGSVKDTMAALEKEWGAGAQANIKMAVGAARQLGGDEVMTIMETTGLGNHPAIIKMFAKVGAILAEDDPTFKDVVRGDANSAKSDKAKIMNDQKHPYWDNAHPGHKAAVAEMQRLNEIIDASDV